MKYFLIINIQIILGQLTRIIYSLNNTIIDPLHCGSKFMCKTSHLCIDRSKVCDFHNDCSDGSDELECGYCDFNRKDEHGNISMCGWRNTGVGKRAWVVVSSDTFNQNFQQKTKLPQKDSSGLTHGNYLVIRAEPGKFN